MSALRFLAAVALALSLGPAARAQQPAPSPSPPVRLPVFPGGVEQVVVDVVVADGKGQAVAGLGAADFTLTEEGSPREILSFEAVAPEDAATMSGAASQARLTRAFAVVIDDVHLTPSSAERVKGAVRELLSTALRESDELALIRTSSGRAWAGRVGGDRASLLAALDGSRGLRSPAKTCEMTDEEAMRIDVEHDIALRRLVFERFVKCRLLIAPPQPMVERPGVAPAPPPVLGGEAEFDSMAADQHLRAMASIRATYRTLETLLRALAPLRGRKSVILASEGFVRDRAIGEVQGVVSAASEANAAVYFLDARESALRGLSAAPDTPARTSVDELMHAQPERFFGSEATELLASETGGTVLRGSDLGQGLRRLADESRTYYLLGYSPVSRALDGRFRAIRVEVRRPGLTVRARHGYYAVQRAGPPPANVAVTAPPATTVPAAPAPALPDAAAGYGGDAASARARVAGWSADQADKAVAALKASNAADDVVEAAALAHAAAAVSAAEPIEHQARAARQSAALVRDPARRSALERRVLLGLAHRYLDARQWQVAQDLALEATQRLVDDADALLALGIVQETTGSVFDGGRRPNPDRAILTAGFDEMVSRNPVTGFTAGAPGRPTGRVPDTQRRMSQSGGPTAETRLRRAAETYRRALKARPDEAEAKLRLGRTLTLLNEAKPAAEELEAVAAGSDADLCYLARLFLGDLKEQQGDFAGAATEYQAALGSRKNSAVARLALARAQQAKGDPAAAQAALQALLLEPANDPQGDPWWRYRLRPLGRWADTLADAR